MVLYPDLNQKKGLILNAVGTLRAMGWERPRVAVLCAVEKVNPRMKETVEAAELAEIGHRTCHGFARPAAIAGLHDELA